MAQAQELPIGRPIRCTFGEFTPTPTLLGPEELRVDIPGAGSQVVGVAPLVLRGGLLLMSWTERDGTVVVHVHDYELGTVHSHARLVDGTLLRSVGTIG